MFLRFDRVVQLLHLPSRRRPPTEPKPIPMDRAAAETLAQIAHELRQPLAAAFAALGVIRSFEYSKHREHATAVIDRQLHRLARLVEDLIETTRMRVHLPSLHVSRLDVRKVAEEVVDAVAPHAGAKRQHLTIAVPNAPLLVNGDSIRLQQIFSNLLTNAIDYTEQGGFIRVSIEKKGSNAVLTVADSGQGIPPDQMQKIFEPFVQGDSGSEQGLGVGLAVVRQLVALHGGTISVDSAGPHQGSTFVVSIPAVQVPAYLAGPDREQVH